MPPKETTPEKISNRPSCPVWFDARMAGGRALSRKSDKTGTPPEILGNIHKTGDYRQHGQNHKRKTHSPSRQSAHLFAQGSKKGQSHHPEGIHGGQQSPGNGGRPQPYAATGGGVDLPDDHVLAVKACGHQGYSRKCTAADEKSPEYYRQFPAQASHLEHVMLFSLGLNDACRPRETAGL